VHLKITKKLPWIGQPENIRSDNQLISYTAAAQAQDREIFSMHMEKVLPAKGLEEMTVIWISSDLICPGLIALTRLRLSQTGHIGEAQLEQK
jgi:hypothetical protein